MQKKYDFIYKKSGKIFNQHSYWTKQPVDVIEYFIKSLTNESDIVLDPFCGSGMTGLAASSLNRNCILVDNSPAAIHISKGYNQNISFKKDTVLDFLDQLDKKLSNIYSIKDPDNGCDCSILFEVLGEVYDKPNGKKFSEAKGNR